MEFPLMLPAGTAALALAGGGAFAVHNVLAARRSGTGARAHVRRLAPAA